MSYDKPKQNKAIVLGTMYLNVPKDAPPEDIAGCKKAVDYLEKIKARFSCSAKAELFDECALTSKGYRLFTGMVSKYRAGPNQPDFCLVARTPQPEDNKKVQSNRVPAKSKQESDDGCPF